MKLGTLAQFSNNAPRFKEIVSIIAKYGLANWINENDPQFIKSLLKSTKGDRITEMTPATRLRMALTELGTTFIKLGQFKHPCRSDRSSNGRRAYQTASQCSP